MQRKRNSTNDFLHGLEVPITSLLEQKKSVLRTVQGIKYKNNITQCLQSSLIYLKKQFRALLKQKQITFLAAYSSGSCFAIYYNDIYSLIHDTLASEQYYRILHLQQVLGRKTFFD